LAPLRGMAMTWTLMVNRERAQCPAARARADMIRAQAATLIAQGVRKPVRRPTAS
jgi:hypothetical protein